LENGDLEIQDFLQLAVSRQKKELLSLAKMMMFWHHTAVKVSWFLQEISRKKKG